MAMKKCQSKKRLERRVIITKKNLKKQLVAQPTISKTDNIAKRTS
jgi:hypothetical protein